MTDPGNGCVCGHGAYSHWTVIDPGDHSRCIRCDCMEFTPEPDREADD